MKRKNMMPMAGRTVVVTGAAGGKELAQIVLKAQSYLQDAGFDIKFSHSAVAKLIQVAAGFPWFVHVLGQHCVIEADRHGYSTIQRTHVDNAITGIVMSLFVPARA